MFQVTRRGFMVGCSAGIAAMAGGRLSYIALGSPAQEPNQDILVVVFLRGGMDGLSAVFPIAGDDRGHYETSRENIAIPASGNNAALPLTDFFGLHPAGAPLYGLYQDKKVAIIHAAGLTSDTRSHFDAMKYMELGTPDSKSATSGWLTRHLLTAPNAPTEIIMPALAVGNLQPTSLAGSTEAIGMTSPNGFSLGGHWLYEDSQRTALRKIYTNGATWLHEAGVQTLNAIDVVEYGNPGNYTPENGAVYPNNSFGQNLRTVAQMIKLQLGLRVATVDLGGWDTHEYQGDNGAGYFSNQFGALTSGLTALMTDLSNSNGTDHTQRLTIVVMSEFGRTFKQNASRGTDHGHGNVMFVVGGKVNGGVYGSWPGLQTDQLYDRRDLAITTDYRRVLSEILIRRLENPMLGEIFPGYRDYQPSGVVQGADLTPNYDTPTATPTPTPLPGTTIPTTQNQSVYLPVVQK